MATARKKRLSGDEVLFYWSLSSSSTFGNAYLIENSSGTRVLIDCGVPLRRLEDSLLALGVSPASLSAVFITHDHADHVRALTLKKPFAARHGIPVYATRDFWDAWRFDWRETLGNLAEVAEPWRPITVTGSGNSGSGNSRSSANGSDTARKHPGGMRVIAVEKPHDAPGPVGYIIEGTKEKLAVFTDLGHVPESVLRAAHAVDHLVIESNHDREMELLSDRHWYLKQRVLGPRGHLSNDQAADALQAIVTPATKTVLLAHLSLECNLPDLAALTAQRALARAGFGGELFVAPADSPLTCSLPGESKNPRPKLRDEGLTPAVSP